MLNRAILGIIYKCSYEAVVDLWLLHQGSMGGAHILKCFPDFVP